MRRVSVMAAFLAGTLIIGSLTLPAGAKTLSQEDWDKRESVHVTAAPTGKAKEVEVEVVLRRDGTAPIRDKSTLTDIRNTEGDEEYTKLPDGTLSWDNQGEDIHYKGNAAPETLPMEITVTYTLDGVEIAPEALAGKSGHLTMRFDYKNRLARTVEVDKKSCTVPVPLMAITLVPLDEDVFSNVKVTNGKILSLDDSGMALGMVLPGFGKVLDLKSLSYTEDVDIPEYFEISADVRDFALDFTATIVSPGLLDELDEEDLDKNEEISGTSDDIDRAVDAMFDGVDTLKSAVDQLDQGIGSMVAALNTGVETLSAQSGNLSRLYTQFLVLQDNPATEADESLSTLAGRVQAALDAAVAAGDTEAQTHLEEVQKTIAQILDSNGGLLAKIIEENQVASAYVSGGAEGGTKLKEAMQEMRKGVEKFRNGISDFRDNGSGDLKKLSKDADKLQEIMDTLKAMKRAGEDYTSFSGLAEGTKGTVSFLYETEEIKD